MKRNPNLKLLFNSLIFYLIIQVFGLLCARKVLTMPGVREQIAVQQPIDWWQMLISIILITLLLLFFLRIVKKRIPYKVFFGALFLLGVFFTLNIWLAFIPALALSILLFYLHHRFSYVILHNLIIILTIVWAAVLLGLALSPSQAVIILLILSVYDVIAVWKTKHMVKMFTGLAERGILFALMIPARIDYLAEKMPPRPLTMRFSNVKRLSLKSEREKFLFMGTGDIALPMVLVISALLYGNIWSSVFIIAGALLGIVFIHFLRSGLQRGSTFIPALPGSEAKLYYPALPPLAGGAIIGWLIAKSLFLAL